MKCNIANGFLVFLHTSLAVFLFSCRDAARPVMGLEPKMIDAASRHSVTVYHENQIFPKGTGLVLNDNGEILTCFHVIIAYENELHVSTDGKDYYPAKVLKKEYKYDLALLQVDAPEFKQKISGLKEVRWTGGPALSLNQEVYAIASPYGLAGSFMKGYIAHTDRSGADPVYPEIPFIQTSGISFPGVSGAGVFLNNGSYIGINRATFGFSEGNGIGMVIPAAIVKTFLGEAE